MATETPASKNPNQIKPYLLEILQCDPLARFLSKKSVTSFIFGLIAFICGISERIGPNPLARKKAMEYVKPVRWSGWTLIAISVGIFEAIYIQFVIVKENIVIWETVYIVMVISYLLIRVFSFTFWFSLSSDR